MEEEQVPEEILGRGELFRTKYEIPFLAIGFAIH